jgi:hypothetical protein
MSFSAMAWASKQKVKSASQKLVLLMLANYADDQDKCWPSKQTLADMCCLSKSGICKTISQLEDSGLLQVEKRDGTSSLIRLNTDVHQVDRGCLPSRQGVSTTRTGGVHPVDTNLSMNQSEEPITETISPDSEFEEFWAAYPKRPNNPRKKAMAAYKKARKTTSQEKLLTSVGEYSAYMQGENPKFVAMASTWLNDERWNCDYSKGADVIKAYKSTKTGDAVTVSDEDLDAVVNQYKGIVSDRMAARAILAAEIAGGTPLDRIVEAAEKYAMHRRQMRYDGIEIAAPILETWLKFKWREMDAYFISKSPMRKPILKPLSERRK